VEFKSAIPEFGVYGVIKTLEGLTDTLETLHSCSQYMTIKGEH